MREILTIPIRSTKYVIIKNKLKIPQVSYGINSRTNTTKLGNTI